MYRVVLGIILATTFTSLVACGSSQTPNPNDPGAKAASSADAPAEERSADKMR